MGDKRKMIISILDWCNANKMIVLCIYISIILYIIIIGRQFDLSWQSIKVRIKNFKDSIIFAMKLPINKLIISTCLFAVIVTVSNDINTNSSSTPWWNGSLFYIDIIINAVIITYVSMQLSRANNKNINEHSLWSLYNISENTINKITILLGLNYEDIMCLNASLDVINKDNIEVDENFKFNYKREIIRRFNLGHLNNDIRIQIKEVIEEFKKDSIEWSAIYSSVVDERYITSLRECNKIFEIKYFDREYAEDDNINYIKEHLALFIINLILNKKTWFEYYCDTNIKFGKMLKKNGQIRDLIRRNGLELNECIRNSIELNYIRNNEQGTTLIQRRYNERFLLDEDFIDNLIINHDRYISSKDRKIIRNYYRFIENSNDENKLNMIINIFN